MNRKSGELSTHAFTRTDHASFNLTGFGTWAAGQVKNNPGLDFQYFYHTSVCHFEEIEGDLMMPPGLPSPDDYAAASQYGMYGIVITQRKFQVLDGSSILCSFER